MYNTINEYKILYIINTQSTLSLAHKIFTYKATNIFLNGCLYLYNDKISLKIIYTISFYHIIKPGVRRPVAGARLVSWKCFCVDICMCVCPPPRLLITSGVMWTPCDWLNKFYSCIWHTVVIIINGRGLGIGTRCTH